VLKGAAVPDDLDIFHDALSRRITTDGEYRRIFIRNLVINVNIGIHPHEIGQTQRLSFDVDLYLTPPTAPLNDNIDNVLNYDFVYEEVQNLTRDRHINLQETLVEELVETCLKRKMVWGVRVATSKLDVYENCGAVGYEIFRTKSA